MAPSSTIATLFSTSDARPELFGYHRVDWITGPADADGEAPWSTSDMIIGKGWRPTTYDEPLMRALFGAPERVAPHTRAWAFALEAAPDFGVMLAPVGGGVVVPRLWDRGFTDLAHWGHGSRLVNRSSSMWLNALADFQREALRDRPPAPPPAVDPARDHADAPPVRLTPADLPDLAARLAREPGPVVVPDLDRWSDADLDDLRFGLSTLDQSRPARIADAPGTLDGLVDHIVAALGRARGQRVLRAHRPDLWTAAERARIEAAMDPTVEDGVWFYIDGEPEPMDSGLLFDVYEPYIFDDMD